MNASMPTPCPLRAENLAPTLPTDLSPAERAALNAHLTTCPAWAAGLAEYRAMDRRILSLPPVAPLTSFSPELAGVLTGQNTLSRAMNMPGSINRPQANTRRRSLAPILSTLAAVFVIATLITGYLFLFATHPSTLSN